MDMFNNFTTLLNSLDNVAKETLEEPKPSATLIRSLRKGESGAVSNTDLEVLAEEVDPEIKESSSTDALASEEATPFAPAPQDAALQSELKKRIKLQKKEIDKLNGECIELEDSCAALKKEVTEAWDSYRVAQEKAALREEELQDEIKQLQRAKLTDKQQAAAQMTRMTEEVAEGLRLMKLAQAERDVLASQVQGFQANIDAWSARETELLTELSQARSGSVIGAQDLLDSLAAAEKAAQQMRIEHASILRQSQLRQNELERSVTEMSSSLAEKDKELSRLQVFLQQTGRDEASAREQDSLRQQLSVVLGQLDEERDRCGSMERRVKAIECEIRANALSYQDERERAKELVRALEVKISSLEDSLKEAASKAQASSSSTGSLVGDSDGPDSTGGSSDWEVVRPDGNSLKIAVEQVQQLSQRLLKHQDLLQELKAEKAALKSRYMDLQARCTRAEQQLNAYKDAEADDGGAEEYYEPEESGSSSSRGAGPQSLLRRKGQGSGMGPSRRGEHKVINDLEKIGVKAGPSVTRAVNLIDSWTLVIGRFLRQYPLVRFLFVFYLLFLHVWVFVVLSFHAHSMDEDAQSPMDQMLNRKAFIRNVSAASSGSAAIISGSP